MKANRVWKKIREGVCTVTGHWFSPTEVIVFDIKTNDRNRDMSATLTCKCCGGVFVHKDAPDEQGVSEKA